MKWKSFARAAFLVALLSLLWVLLLLKLRGPERPASSAPPEQASAAMTAAAVDAPAADQPAVEQPAGQQLAPTAGPAAVPQDWREWFDYLDGQTSPEAMRAALAALRGQLLALPPVAAIEQMLAFIGSRADLRTGLALQIRADGTVRAAHSLRALLLDWLSELDPDLAAAIALRELRQDGTALAPDVFAIHLRNLAKAELPTGEVRPVFEQALADLLGNAQWLENPTSAVAESLDLAVYLRAVEHAPLFVEWLRQPPAQPLSNAAALLLERLIDLEPIATGKALLAAAGPDDVISRQRARLLARIDPVDDAARQLLRDYLTHPQVSYGELKSFLLSFPNFDQTVSFNLLSDVPLVNARFTLEQRLQHALRQLLAWQADPALSHLAAPLQTAIERARYHLYPP